MRSELPAEFDQVVKGRNLIILAVTDIVLFLIANVAYGGGNQHGLRNDVSMWRGLYSWSASSC